NQRLYAAGRKRFSENRGHSRREVCGQGSEIVPQAQFFTATDYVMVMPIMMLSLFALFILLFDVLAPEYKRLNAVVALGGLFFAATGITGLPSFWKFRGTIGIYRHIETLRLHRIDGQPALSGSMLIDAFTVYFWALFLAAAAISILISMHYLD